MSETAANGRRVTDRERYAMAAYLQKEHDSIAEAAAYYGADEIAVESLVAQEVGR